VFVVLCGVQMDLESGNKDEMKKMKKTNFWRTRKMGKKIVVDLL